MDKKFFAIILTIFLIGLATILILQKQIKHEIVFYDEGVTVVVNTTKNTLGKAIEISGLDLREEDDIQYEKDFEITENLEIFIVRSKPVTILMDEEIIEIYTTSSLVKDILQEAGIVTGENDIIYPSKEDPIFADRKIEIVKVEIVNTVVEEIIAYDIITKYTDNENIEEKPGVKGLRECTFENIYENGKLISQELISEKVLVEPEPEYLYSELEKYFVTNRGKPFRYSKMMTMEATAYDLSYESCGKYPDDPGYGITYLGTNARPGVIAVDKGVIPLGSTVYVESLDYTNDYGFSLAEDTGSAILGDRIDLFIENKSEALSYGRRYVKVYIIDEEIDRELVKGYGN